MRHNKKTLFDRVSASNINHKYLILKLNMNFMLAVLANEMEKPFMPVCA